MQATLAKLDEENRWSGWTTAVYLIGGAAWLGIAGVATFVDDDQFGDGLGRAIAATGAIAIGAPTFALGIYGLTGPTSTDEYRFARFQREQRTGSLSPTALSRYEGELRAEAAISRQHRNMAGAAGIGVAVGGATLITFGATSHFFGDMRWLAYAEGGLMVLMGTAQGISSLASESANEREWRLYQKGSSTEHVEQLRIGVTPTVGPHSASLSIVGQF